MNFAEEEMRKTLKSEKEYKDFLVTFGFWMNQSSYGCVYS